MRRSSQFGSAGHQIIQSQLSRGQQPRRRRTCSLSTASALMRGSTTPVKSSTPSIRWPLLRRVTLRSVSPDEAVAFLEISERAPRCHNASASKFDNKVYIDAEGLERILNGRDFTTFDVPSIPELCEQRLAHLTVSKSEPLEIYTSLDDRDGHITVSIYGDLRSLFSQLVTSRSSEFSWRLAHGLELNRTAENARIGINSVDVDGVVEASTPSEFVLPLLPHQQKSLAWMMMRETKEEPCVHERQSQRRCKWSGLELDIELQVSELFSICGGVLCDVVGSGKTATVLALLCAQDRAIRLADLAPDTSKTTLILCPANVHAQWLTEIQKFCPGALNVVSLQVATDVMAASDDSLSQADIVIAPYELFTMVGVACGQDALKDLRWRRIVIDEFHELVSQANGICFLKTALKFLKAERQWGLSGTPESFLHEANAVAKAADCFRCDISSRTAPVFAEHYCRQARIAIPVEVHEHVVHVSHTPAERALYFHASQQVEYGSLSKFKWEGSQSEAVQRLLLLSSHFLPNEDNDVNVRDSNLSADEVCTAMVQRKEDTLGAAMAKVTSQPRMRFQNFCILVETMDEKLNTALLELKRPKGIISSHQDELDLRSYKKISAEIVQPRKTMYAHINKVRQWSKQSEGQRLLDVVSPQELYDLCAAVEVLRGHVTLEGDQSEELRRFVHRICRDCELIMDAQRDLDFFNRTFDAFQSGSTSCPVCLEDMDAYVGNFLFCGHAICVACAKRLKDDRCPICRAKVPDINNHSVQLISCHRNVVPPRQLTTSQLQDRRKNLSSKLCKVIETLRFIHSSDSTAKVLIFSQFNSLRRHVDKALSDEGFKHLSLEGNIFDRTRTLNQFNLDPCIQWLLLSLEDSASGTNLTAASHVILLHPMMTRSRAEAASFEAQAVGRVRRLGQTKPVHVWRFMTIGTLEETFWDAQTIPQSS